MIKSPRENRGCAAFVVNEMKRKLNYGGEKMYKKIISTLVIGTLLAGTLTGCGGSSDAGSSAKSSGKTELELFSTKPENKDTIQKLVDKYNESHDDVTVKVTAPPDAGTVLKTRMAKNDMPDIVAMGGDNNYTEVESAGMLLDLGDQDYIKDVQEAYIDMVYDVNKDKEETIYGVPFATNASGVIYNTEKFEELGLEVPKTWDEFFALGDTVKDIDGRSLFTYQGIYPGYMEEMLWPAIANECGEEALTKIANYEEGSFNNEGVLKALTHIKEIADKGYLLEGTVGMNHTESQTEMMLGKAAFITNGTWMENEMQDAPREDRFEFAMAPIPTENADDVHYVFDSCEQFSIPAAAKNQELAKEFLRFLYSDESVSAFAEASGALYATKSAREVAKDKLSTAIYNMYGIYDEANASSLIMSFSAVPADCKINPKDEIFNPITSVMNDEMTVEEWAQNVEDAFAQIRADQEAAK